MHSLAGKNCVVGWKETEGKAAYLRMDGPRSLIVLLVIVSSLLEAGERVCVEQVGGSPRDFEFLTLSGWTVEEKEE